MTASSLLNASRAAAARLVALLVVMAVRFVTAVRVIWRGVEPVPEQRIYFANHRSNGDFALLWTALPPRMRARTRPVAAADYWLRSGIRRFVIRDVFDAVLIERDPARRAEDPVGLMTGALDTGASLILFPEGLRNMTEAPLAPFKTGLYHVARARPGVALVPAWIENLNRVLPKGEIVPVPIICTVTFGAAIHLMPGEDKETFLARATGALIELSEAEGGA